MANAGSGGPAEVSGEVTMERDGPLQSGILLDFLLLVSLLLFCP